MLVYATCTHHIYAPRTHHIRHAHTIYMLTRVGAACIQHYGHLFTLEYATYIRPGHLNKRGRERPSGCRADLKPCRLNPEPFSRLVSSEREKERARGLIREEVESLNNGDSAGSQKTGTPLDPKP